MKTLKHIGEIGLIERVGRKALRTKGVIRGIGDDAAVISYTKDKYLLLACDMLVEDVHFNLREASFEQIGRKALAVNISDIAAMGGTPKYALISIGMPANLKLRTADEIIHGITSLADEHNISIVGGDTSRAGKIFLNISLVGEVKKKYLTLRSGAKWGDLIFVTGSLGKSRKLKQFNFIPRIKEAQSIIRKFNPTAMMDLSDGLAADLEKLARQSKAGAVIFEELIPLSRGAELGDALYEGEDFELLFTMSLACAHKFYGNKEEKLPISCIGKIIEEKRGISIIDKNAKERSLKQKGFNHF